MVDVGERREQPLAAIDAHHVEVVAGEPSPIEIIEKMLPFGGAFRLGEAEVDYLFLPSGSRPRATRTVRLTAPAPVFLDSTTPSSISTF
jgi:hypothetical protein